MAKLASEPNKRVKKQSKIEGDDSEEIDKRSKVKVTDEMFLAAAHSLAGQVNEEDLAQGSVYPPLGKIREVCALIAYEVAKIAWDKGLTDRKQPADIMAEIKKQMYQPLYPHYA